jgi:hypothetical protein
VTGALSGAEREILGRIAEVGGRYTFQPDGSSIIAHRIFAEGMLSVLLALEEKRLISLTPPGAELVRVALGLRRFVPTTAQLTDAGRRALGGGIPES